MTDQLEEVKKLLEGQRQTRRYFEKMGWGDSAESMTPGVEALEWAVDQLSGDYEYNIQTTDDDGESFISDWEWSLVPDGLEKDLVELVQWDKDVDTGFTRRLVKRRRAGKVEHV